MFINYKIQQKIITNRKHLLKRFFLYENIVNDKFKKSFHLLKSEYQIAIKR